VNSIEEIKSLHRGYWFSEDSMSFFRTRISLRVYPTPEGTYFVTSEQMDGRGPRRYSVRVATLVNGEAHINTVGEFRGFATWADAHREARRLAV
jgi:hypothetical protein